MIRFVTLAWGWLALAACMAAAEPDSRPNIIVLLADDLGYADLGVQGCRDIATPRIDGIARRGIRFTQAYANGSFCTPTRAALLSGRYQQRYGMDDLTNVTGPLPPEVRTLPERLQAVGYRAGLIGKWHLGETAGFTPLDQGFADFFGFYGGLHAFIPLPGTTAAGSRIWRNRERVVETRYLTEAFAEEAVAFVRRAGDDPRPFFLYLPFNAVHTPLQATANYLERVSQITAEPRRTYAAMLVAMDDAVGRVLAEVEAVGKLDNTIVLFSSDNGGPTTRNGTTGCRNTPLRGSKCETFEGGIRVPLLWQWPKVLPAGATFDRPCLTFDVTATLLAAAGADMSELDGVDLLPFTLGRRSDAPHEALFWRSRPRSDNYAARIGDWKFVHSTEGGEQPGPSQRPARDLLFHLAEDHAEQHDLATKHPEQLAELKRRYDAWSASMDEDCRRRGLKIPAIHSRSSQ